MQEKRLPSTTRWFSASVKPVRVGMYQTMCRHNDAVLWRYWNGEFWGWGYENKRWAYSWRKEPLGTQTDPWRGLTAPFNVGDDQRTAIAAKPPSEAVCLSPSTC